MTETTGEAGMKLCEGYGPNDWPASLGRSKWKLDKGKIYVFL